MTEERWTAVDRYLSDLLVSSDAALQAALEASADAGLPAVNVAPNQGKLLHLLVLACGAQTVLEIGMLGGYSTIWLARGLPASGHLVSLEADPRHVEVARRNIERAQLSDVVEIMVGPAAESLPKLKAQHRPPFDLVFIDADKPSTAEYFAWSLELSHVGSLIIVDNVVRSGQVSETGIDDPNVEACDASWTRWPQSLESAQRRFRPWASRDTTDSCSPWSPPRPRSQPESRHESALHRPCLWLVGRTVHGDARLRTAGRPPADDVPVIA